MSKGFIHFCQVTLFGCVYPMPVYPINAWSRIAAQKVGRFEQTEGFARLHQHLFVPGSASIKVSWQGLTSFIQAMQRSTAVLAVPSIKNPITLIALHRPWNIPCAHKLMTKLWPMGEIF